jgi:glycosyltransferase involved in cell wall biosynthesis
VKDKILIIPHHPGLEGIKIRLIEMAKALSERYEVYLLHWNAVQTEYTLLNRLTVTLRDLFKWPRLYKKDSFTVVELPMLHRPIQLARPFNRFWILKLLKRKKIKILINGTFDMVSFPVPRDFLYLYDLADLPGDGLQKDTVQELKSADIPLVVSQVLAEHMQRNYGLKTYPVPNGADIRRMRTVSSHDTMAIRREYGLEGKWVIGYVGNIGSWVNVDLMVQAFRLFQKDVPESVLLWIGPSPNLKKLRSQYGAEDIIFTGPVNKTIEPYFRVLDIGILPHIKNSFQDAAFHLKLVEYTVARIPVIATALMESMRLGFPNIKFVSETPGEWAGALLQATTMQWQNEWDVFSEQYDWQHIGSRLDSLIRERRK